ncbi:beta-carotene ketolase [Geminocystis sp. NIES-3708]|uniref:fatty acid desaturase n=1 Tax=Geminocystis sp. NIES-3708 TaxID=1615909 RepID=UPI0005FCD9E7|nr:fatty acid desaturase [Geminocystis sp. NIES-3708]BAQ61457.1 beta-carotene ketolase [Geminocystis sp. NIES-3708]
MGNYLGLVIALVIIALWILTFSMYQINDLTKINYLIILLLILWQTFLNTGLFIIAHDGMHGLIFPTNIKLNHFIGSFCLTLYACLSYENLKEKHFLHHRFSGTNLDPDFHNTNNISFLRWYGEFMNKYLSVKHLFRLSAVVLFIAYFCKITWVYLLLFWALPLILSSLQLFFFGTYLPHRQCNQKEEILSIKSLYLPVFLSLIACYHFSYHREHHQYPFVPWWQLPSLAFVKK